MFERRAAERELRQYRAAGPGGTTRLLIDALKAEGVAGLTLLDIGGGVGAIQHELLRAGVRSATAVDASSAYLDAARAEVARLGHADRVVYHHGDFVEVAPRIEPHDIVTLDRVICCYHALEALVGLSALRARRLYGLVYPRDTWWIRAAVPVQNTVFRLVRNPFRIFVHATAAVDAIARRHGLRPRFSRRTPFWQIVVYAR